MNLSIPIAVGIGGFAGALLRFYTSAAIVKTVGTELAFVATIAVNLLGCFAIGTLWTLVLKTSHLSPAMQRLLITGLLGSLTTFSTFALDSLILLQSGRVRAAIANLSVNVFAGLLLVWAGMAVTGMFVSGETSG